jgi:hypothetical protein
MTHVDPRTLNSRQIENYNFAKLSAILADYGFNTMRLSADWNGADLIAQHIDGSSLQVQLKGRFGFWQKYRGKSLYMAFPATNGEWYLYPHDELLQVVLPRIESTPSWKGETSGEAGYSWPGIPAWAQDLLEPYRVKAALNGGLR